MSRAISVGHLYMLEDFMSGEDWVFLLEFVAHYPL